MWRVSKPEPLLDRPTLLLANLSPQTSRRSYDSPIATSMNGSRTCLRGDWNALSGYPSQSRTEVNLVCTASDTPRVQRRLFILRVLTPSWGPLHEQAPQPALSRSTNLSRPL